LLDDVVARNIGVHVGPTYFGCVMYADDIVILSPFLVDLQLMHNVCTEFGRTLDVIFNSKKSLCVIVVKLRNTDLPPMYSVSRKTALLWLPRRPTLTDFDIFLAEMYCSI